VSGGSFGCTFSGCTAGQTNTYSQFYTVQAETPSPSFSSLGGNFEVFSTFVISNGGSTPSASLASGAGGCSGLDGITNNGYAGCTGTSTSGTVPNSIHVSSRHGRPTTPGRSTASARGPKGPKITW
jgi:hypothetical protein